MARFKPVNVELNGEQEAEADRIAERLTPLFAEEVRRMARRMASKPARQLLGPTEFELRDRLHALGAEVLEVTAAERVKKGGLSRS